MCTEGADTDLGARFEHAVCACSERSVIESECPDPTVTRRSLLQLGEFKVAAFRKCGQTFTTFEMRNRSTTGSGDVECVYCTMAIVTMFSSFPKPGVPRLSELKSNQRRQWSDTSLAERTGSHPGMAENP